MGLNWKSAAAACISRPPCRDKHSSLLRDGSLADNEILSTAMSLRESHPGNEIVLVSKDINLRIKAAILGVQAEDYYNDRALDDLSLLYRGLRQHDETLLGRLSANRILERKRPCSLPHTGRGGKRLVPQPVRRHW